MNAGEIVRSLDLVAARGDPAPAVYARLFAAHPDMERLFVRDTNGLVRGNMLAEAVSAILDFIDRDSYGGNLMRIEIVNHENLGVPRAVFPVFFTAMRDAFAAMLGSDWSTEIDAAWRDLLARIDAALASEKT
jgi:hemoglobin-like flavoprotein